MSAAGHHIAEESVHHSLLDAEVDDCLLLSVVNSGELGLLRFLLHYLHLLDNLGRDVLRREGRVVQEEGFSVYGYLADSLSVGGHASVFADFHAREFLEKVLEHVVVSGLEG